MRRTLPIVAILLLAAALRFYQITAQSLWFDEGIAVHAASQPSLWGVVTADPTNPPFYFVLLHAVIRLAGDSLLALRWLSAMTGVLVVALAYRLARRLFDEAAGRYAALLAACSPLLWWASQEVRMYALMAALALVAAWTWDVLRVRPTRAAWALLWTCEVVMLYAHNSAPVLVLWLNAATALVWLERRSLRSPDWRPWIAGQLAVGVLWLPWLITRFALVPAANQAAGARPVLTLDLADRMWQALWTGPWAMVGKEAALTGLSTLLLLVSLFLIACGGAASRRMFLHVLLISAGLLAGLMFIDLGLHPRYLVALTPLLLVAIAGGLSRLERLRAPLSRAAPLLALAPFVLVSGLAVYLATHNPAYAHDDVEGMVRYYAGNLKDGDTVLAWTYADVRYDLAYYWPRLDVKAALVPLSEGAPLEDVLPRLPATGAVAVNEWYAQVAGQTGMLDCLLAHGSETPPEQFDVYGMGDELYRSPSRVLPVLRPFQAAFSVAQVSALGELPAFNAAQALCLPVRVTLAQPLARVLKAALIARNSLGWEIARADARFSGPREISSAQAVPGTALTAFPLLRLPYGAPAQDYTLVLRLYDEQDPSGYDVIGANGMPAGKDLALGTWHAAPGADWSRVPASGDWPVRTTLPAGNGLALIAHNAETSRPIHNGDRLQLALLWQGTGALPALRLRASSGAWSVDLPAPQQAARALVTLDWREARVPADATSGTVDLSLQDGALVARYTLDALPATFIEPPFGSALGRNVPGIGQLAGYTLEGERFQIGRPLSITLVWRAGESAIETRYKVFVHLVGADGRILAQSDAEPAQGSRPTAGWRPGEYIVDAHQLTFNADAVPGPATLRVGLYDPLDGRRPAFEDGADAASLPASVTVVP